MSSVVTSRKVVGVNEYFTTTQECQQECVNSERSYFCQCRDGYDLTGQPTILKLTSSASGQSTCLLRAPFSSLSTTQHMESMAGLLVQMTISSSLMVWREREGPSLGKFCKLDVPPPITTSTGAV